MSSENGSGRKQGCFTKTRMCRFHILGLCARGSQCAFAHDKIELNAAPDFTRTKLCKVLRETGVCEDRSCQFAHTADELRSSSTMFLKTKMCFFHQMGHCSLGSKCNFAHAPTELRGQPLFQEPDVRASSSNSGVVNASTRVAMQASHGKTGKTQTKRGQLQNDKTRTTAEAFAKPKPVGLVKGPEFRNSKAAFGGLSPEALALRGMPRAEAPLAKARSSEAEERSPRGRVPAAIPGSPCYLFQAEPDRPGSFVPLRKDHPEYSQVVIGQIAGISKPKQQRVSPDAWELDGFAAEEFHQHFGMGQSLTFQPDLRGGDIFLPAGTKNPNCVFDFHPSETDDLVNHCSPAIGTIDHTLPAKGLLFHMDRDFAPLDDHEPPIPISLTGSRNDKSLHPNITIQGEGSLASCEVEVVCI